MSENIKIEDKINEFEKIIEKLENGDLSLDDSIDVFYEGMKLSKEISVKINNIEKKISELIEDEKGLLKEINFKSGENNGV